jgi:hypothetical protein
MTRAMRLRSSVTVALCSLLFAVVASAQGGSKKAKPPAAKADVSKCVSVRTEAIYGAYGYDHHVHVHNGCDKAVRCEVTTNSNPEVTTVILGKGETQDVVMFRGSPASELSANTKCSAIDDA